MILQAFEYEQKGHSLQDFFDSTEGKFKSECVIELVQELYARRKAYWADKR
jgi:hypothetical protein